MTQVRVVEVVFFALKHYHTLVLIPRIQELFQIGVGSVTISPCREEIFARNLTGDNNVWVTTMCRPQPMS